MQNQTGKNVAVLDGYSFYCDGRGKTTNQWICTWSTQGKNCKARFTTTKDNEQILKTKIEHTLRHPRPQYVIRDGIFYRM